MSASQIRSQLERKRKQRIDAEKRVGEFRNKESQKRADAAKARSGAAKSSSESTARSKLGESERREREAETAGKEAGRWQLKVSGYAREESSLASKLAQAERSEADAAERKRVRERTIAARKAAADRSVLESRIGRTESTIELIVQQRTPKPEKLRVLILGASSVSDLRVGREQKRIRSAVESALHSDLIELDVRPAATAGDLLNGITKFRPHVVHFSGHSDDDIIVFEDEVDQPHAGVAVSARAFAHAIEATDDPPLLVLLNSCNSAAQIDDLVARVIPFAIGMADEIEDADAINYAAQFYAAIANGQSISSSHRSGRAALELAGLAGADLPTLAHTPFADPTTTALVRPPP